MLGERAGEQVAAQVGVHEAARREQPGDRVGRLQGVHEPAGAARAVAQRGRRALRAADPARGPSVSASDATRCLR